MKLSKSSRPRNTKTRAQQQNDGFSLHQLVDKISRLQGVEANKGLRRQVAVALQRGVNYGILVRVRNKYRYDPETALSNAMRSAGYKKSRRNNRGGARITRRRRRQLVKKPVVQSESQSSQQQQPQRSPPRVPRPTVPPPPNWTQKPRNLSSEPLTKVIKHPNAKKRK